MRPSTSLRAVPFVLAALASAPFAQVDWTPVQVLEARQTADLLWNSAEQELRVHLPSWGWDGDEWRSLPTTGGPGPLADPAFAFDEGRGRTVLVAGGSGPLTTWELIGSQWTEMQPAVSPPDRLFPEVAYDSARGVVVLFGGSENGTGVLFDDTWEWDGLDWVERLPATRPPQRWAHQMAYDSGRGRLVVYGGRGIGKYFHDTWEWDGNDWHDVTPAVSPTASYNAAMAYDPVRERVTLFGGYPSQPLFYSQNATWEWDGATWIERYPATVPLARIWHGMSFDPRVGQVVMLGGYDSLTTRKNSLLWGWDGNDWSVLASPSPGELFFSAVAYDSGRDRVVLFGGGPSGSGFKFDETWEWDGERWDRIDTAPAPPSRRSFDMAYDPLRGRTVLFGGAGVGSSDRADTWEWDGQQWVELTPPGSPSARREHAMAWDPISGRVILYGGYSFALGRRLEDTWAWDGATWTSLSATGPGRLRLMCMTDRGPWGQVLLFGGETRRFGETVYTNDTWAWDGAAWSRLAPTNSPTPPLRSVMTWDAARARVVMMGRVGYAYEIWEFDGLTWQERSTTAGFAAALATGNQIEYHAGEEHVLGINLDPGKGVVSWLYAPLDPASIAPFGTACAGSAGTPVLATTGLGLPWMGDPLRFSASPVPYQAPAILFIGTSSTAWNGLPLPHEMSGFGMPGCTLYTSTQIRRVMTTADSSAAVSVTLPTMPSLAGLRFFAQATVRDPAANAAGWVLTNALDAVLGSR